ncbi:MAG: hypothetical protein ACE5IK_11450 [Acidobacteriota bacterium]
MNAGIQVTTTSPAQSKMAAVSGMVGLLLLALLGCAGAGVESLDPGRYEGRTYVQDQFGLRITFPEDWNIVADAAAAERIDAAGRQMLSAGDPTGDAYRSAGPSTSRNLFTVYRFPLGTVQGLNPSLIAGVENVMARPEIQTPVDYLEMLKDFLTRGGTPIQFQPIAADTSLGGQSFAVLGATIQAGQPPIGQVYFCRRLDPYMLTVVASFTTQAQWLELQAVLDTMTLEK